MILQTTRAWQTLCHYADLRAGVVLRRLCASEKIMHGDGGSAPLMRRMRAHSNFIEYTPIALILIVTDRIDR